MLIFTGKTMFHEISCISIRSIMTLKEINIRYKEYGRMEELPEDDRILAQEAVKATGSSYSPYSGFHVGAALRLSNGEIVRGSNQENIAYPSGLCAERTAMFYASATYPDSDITAIAIAASQNGEICRKPATPCGACRQVMAEYQTRAGKDMKIILAGTEQVMVFDKVEDILPFIFDSLK